MDLKPIDRALLRTVWDAKTITCAALRESLKSEGHADDSITGAIKRCTRRKQIEVNGKNVRLQTLT